MDSKEKGFVWIPVLLLIVIATTIGSAIYVRNNSKASTVSPTPSTKCVTGGCSGQLCLKEGNKGMITTCEYRDEYACLKKSVCEVQSDGQCGWTQTTAYKECLAQITNTPTGFTPQ